MRRKVRSSVKIAKTETPEMLVRLISRGARDHLLGSRIPAAACRHAVDSLDEVRVDAAAGDGLHHGQVL